MKKLALIFVLTFMMTFAVFAEDEGHTHTGGGRNCPPDQTCRFSTENPDESKNDFITEIITFLSKMFD